MYCLGLFRSKELYINEHWYYSVISVKELCFKYELSYPLDLLHDPPNKESWKRTVNKQVNNYWVERIRNNAILYTRLRYLHADEYRYGRRHPVIQTIGNARGTPRINMKLKLVTGTYILQCNQAVFSKNQIEPTCLLCKTEEI